MNFLSRIIEIKKEEVKKLRQNFSPAFFRESEFFDAPVQSLRKALQHNDRLGIIAEIKKASPSKGILRHEFDHIEIADTYIKNDVDAISILTDRIFFGGNISFLQDIARFKTVPLLRKDFIIDEYQIFEAKANGADAVLLIAETLSQNQISELTSTANEYGLEVLLEIHSSDQFDKIDFAKNNLIGINNRNLETFKVDLSTTRRLSKLIPGNVVLVSESGLNSIADVKEIRTTKVNAVLTGEHFMRSDNIADSIKNFMKWCSY